jgi:hypothetical protein
MSAGNGTQPYRLSYSEAVRLRVVALQEAAVRSGCRAELAAALRTMLDKLVHEPLTWGDIQFEYHAAKLARYQRTGPLIIVLYGVHHASRTVYLQEVKPTPGSALAQENGPG